MKKQTILLWVAITAAICIIFLLWSYICYLLWSGPKIPLHTERIINCLGARLSLNVSEIEQLDFQKTKQTLNAAGFEIVNQSHIDETDENNYLSYWVYLRRDAVPPNFSLQIVARNLSGAKYGYVDILDWRGFPESELDLHKRYVINQTNRVATCCNLTLDWTGVEWFICYQDSIMGNGAAGKNKLSGLFSSS